MMEKTPIIPQRVRRINGSFAFIEHRFLRDGFWSSLDHQELLLYMFLIMVGDRRVSPPGATVPTYGDYEDSPLP